MDQKLIWNNINGTDIMHSTSDPDPSLNWYTACVRVMNNYLSLLDTSTRKAVAHITV